MTGAADIARLEARVDAHETTIAEMCKDMKELAKTVGNLRVDVARIVGAWAILQLVVTFSFTLYFTTR